MLSIIALKFMFEALLASICSNYVYIKYSISISIVIIDAYWIVYVPDNLKKGVRDIYMKIHNACSFPMRNIPQALIKKDVVNGIIIAEVKFGIYQTLERYRTSIIHFLAGR